MSDPETVFSPLALTGTLPFLPLAQGDVDYDTASRQQPGLLGQLLAQEGTGVILAVSYTHLTLPTNREV